MIELKSTYCFIPQYTAWDYLFWNSESNLSFSLRTHAGFTLISSEFASQDLAWLLTVKEHRIQLYFYWFWNSVSSLTFHEELRLKLTFSWFWNLLPDCEQYHRSPIASVKFKKQYLQYICRLCFKCFLKIWNIYNRWWFISGCVSACLSMLVRLEFRLVTPAGSSTA